MVRGLTCPMPTPGLAISRRFTPIFSSTPLYLPLIRLREGDQLTQDHREDSLRRWVTPEAPTSGRVPWPRSSPGSRGRIRA